MVWIDFCHPDNIAPMNSVGRLRLLHLVVEVEQCLEFIARKYKDIIRPFRGLGIDIIDAIRPL